MAGYFTVDVSFWTDSDVADNFTPEDKYFYLYLLTCPNANISGCYEISVRQMAYDTGYSKETVERLIERFTTVHRVIDYSTENKEVLVCNWGKYHWTTSPKYTSALRKKISEIKTEKFRDFLTSTMENFVNSGGNDTVWIRYPYGMDTSFTYTYTYNSNPSSEKEIGVQGEEEKQKPEPAKKSKAKKKESPVEKFAEFAGEDTDLLEALHEYEVSRNARKKPLTDRSKTMLINKLRDCYSPDEWIAIIDQSTLRGWDSFYPLKNETDWTEKRKGTSGKNRLTFLDMLREEEIEQARNNDGYERPTGGVSGVLQGFR